jgi:hypothetical protein
MVLAHGHSLLTHTHTHTLRALPPSHPPTSCCSSALWVGGLKHTPEGDLDYGQDFFGRPAFLTVSGQLNGAASILAGGVTEQVERGALESL